MIQVKGLVKTYGSFQLNIDMDVPTGRVTGLVGRNGVGKSTAIKALLGLIRPEAGADKRGSGKDRGRVLGFRVFRLSETARRGPDSARVLS